MSYQIDIWLWSLEQEPEETRKLQETLSPDELLRAGIYIREGDRDRFIAGRGRLRQILAERLGYAPESLVFKTGHHGKPFLQSPTPAPFFNFSRSPALACLAVCDELEPGVDIEQQRPLENEAVEQFFSPREQASLSGLEGDEWIAGFYRCWTRKEAFIKATGEGLSRPLDSFDVSLRQDEPARLLRLEDDKLASERWTILEFDPGRGHRGAIALAANQHKVSLTLHRL